VNHFLKFSVITLIAIGMMFIPGITTSNNNNSGPSLASAQSQSATVKQQSQPSSSQNNINSSQIGQVFTFNVKSLPPNDPQKCANLASVVNGKAVPDYNLCDVVVYRQAPPIIRHDGLVMNNFSGFGHYIEFVPAAGLNNTGMFASNSSSTTSTGNKSQIKAAFGEFALLDSEVVPVRNVMEKYNWTETALHHHMLGETPKVLFLHWSVNGNADDLIKQAKEIMMQTSTYQNLTGITRTPSSAGP
jgi:hypothetical protein